MWTKFKAGFMKLNFLLYQGFVNFKQIFFDDYAYWWCFNVFTVKVKCRKSYWGIHLDNLYHREFSDVSRFTNLVTIVEFVSNIKYSFNFIPYMVYPDCQYCITQLVITCSKPTRGWSRAAATFKMERFVIIVNGFKPLTIITKRSILDVAAVLDPPLQL